MYSKQELFERVLLSQKDLNQDFAIDVLFI
jgi:hypothetical protein